MSEIGTWMKKNKNSIYACGKAGIPKPDNGRLTRNGNKLYYHLYENTIGPMPLIGIKKDQVKSIRYLATGAEAWILAGGAHHTAFSYDLTAEQMGDWAAAMGIEAVYIDKDTTIRNFKNELRWNEVAFRK